MEILAALQGLNSTQAHVDQAAKRIAQADNPDGSSGDTVDLEAETVNLSSAKIAYEVNVKVLQTGDEMAKHTRDIIA